ncbi:MAG: hypothetical protein CVV05_02260 [Gammaproteobacteria bacterium HGW-Gammaproteobacteria-1]|jgi:hypothetical protein|nr:MAG: hypothetical protein CVV05_02260 [Gammaproteobacteria bacterium HGW-Gammaproteobacteria-1]
MTELHIRQVVSPSMLGLMLGILLLMPMALALATGQPVLEIYTVMYNKVTQKGIDGKLGLDLLQVLLGVAALLFMFARQRALRLYVSAQGIELQNRNPVIRLFIRPWRIVWGQMSEVVLHGAPAARIALEFRIKGGQSRKLGVAEWIRPEGNVKLGWSALRFAFKPPPAHESELLRVLAGYGINVVDRTEVDAARMGFALEKNRYTRVALIVLAVLATYAAIDGIVVLDESFVEEPPLPAFLMAGAMTAMVGMVLLLRFGVPAAESVGLGALVGVALGLASYPATLRINALTDPVGMGQHEYVLQRGAMLYPLTGGLPSLYAPISREFWAAQRIGSTWDIELRQGGLGIWQYRRAPLLEHIRDYHERNSRR